MISMPAKTQLVTNLSFGSYLSAVGTNSRRDMYTIIPPTMPKSVQYALADMLLPCKIKYPTKPPIGSVTPEMNDHQKPFHFEPVA